MLYIIYPSFIRKIFKNLPLIFFLFLVSVILSMIFPVYHMIEYKCYMFFIIIKRLFLFMIYLIINYKKTTQNQLVFGFLFSILLGPIFLYIPLFFDSHLHTGNSFMDGRFRDPESVNENNLQFLRYSNCNKYGKIMISNGLLIRLPVMSNIPLNNRPYFRLNSLTPGDWGMIRGILMYHEGYDMVFNTSTWLYINNKFPSLYTNKRLNLEYEINENVRWNDMAKLIYIVKQRIHITQVDYIKVRLGLMNIDTIDINKMGPRLGPTEQDSVQELSLRELRKYVSTATSTNLSQTSRSEIIKMIPRDIWNRYAD